MEKKEIRTSFARNYSLLGGFAKSIMTLSISKTT